MKVFRTLRKLSVGMAALALLSAAACSSDSPSEPQRQPGTPPGTGGGGTVYNVTVTTSPSSIPAGSTDAVLVSVRAVRADNGQVPPNGTAAVISVSAGALGSLAGPTSTAESLTNGQVQLQYFAPADNTNPVTIQASVAGSVGQAVLQIEEAATFFVSFVDPNYGSPQGGDEVTVRGSGFEPPARVTFGSTNAQVLSVSPNSIRVRTPPSPGGPDQRQVVNVGVTINVNEAEQASDSVTGAFTYTPGGIPTDVPAVFSVTPGTGPNEGGTQVTIAGDGFQAPVQVEFGSAGTFLEAQVLSVSATSIRAVTPAATGFGQALQNQSVDVRVRNLDTGLSAVLGNAFRFGTDVLISGFSPDQGPIGGGQNVTVFGQGFDAPVQVLLGGVEQDVISVTGTEVVFRTAGLAGICGNQSVGLRVVNLETGAFADAMGTYVYSIQNALPLIFKIAPTSGSENGNTQVVLTGENLGNVLVSFNNRPATPVSSAADGSSTTVRSPFLPRAELTTEACDDNDDGAQGERFIQTAVDVTVVDRITTCTFTFPDGYAYNPSDTSCRNDTAAAPAPEPQCNDGIDNDGDTFVDLADPDCANAADDDESM